MALTHVVDVRHERSRDPAFVAQCRKAGVSIVHSHSDEVPQIGDASGFASYARLMLTQERATGYSAAELDGAKNWGRRKTLGVFPLAAPDHARPAKPRDVFLFYIKGAKVRAPRRDGDDQAFK